MSSAPQPALLFSFNGSNVESITGLSPTSQANVAYTNGIYQQAAYIANQAGGGLNLAGITYNTTPTFSNVQGFTISFWFNIVGTITTNCGYFSIHNGVAIGGTTQIATFITQSQTNLVFLQTSSTVSPTNAANPSTRYTVTLASGKWYHVALSVNATNWNQYFQGSLLPTISGAYTPGTVPLSSFSGPLYIGWNNGAQNSPPFLIQDFRMYTTALSTQQILGIYQSQGIPPSLTMVPASGALPGPVLTFPFNGSNVESITGITPLAQYPITGNSALLGNAAYIKTAPTSNTALYCTGPYATSSNCMNLGTSSPANFNYNSSNLFCEFWWYTSNTSPGNLNTPISLGVINTTSTSYRIQVRLNSGFGLNFSTSVSNTTPLSASTWYHFAFSVDSTNKVIYPFVNGFGGVSASYTGTLTYTSTDTLMIGYSNALASTYYYDQYIQDLRVINGGIVPTTNFTPALPPYQYVLPSYVSGTGSIVLTLQSQFVNYTNGLLGAQAINFLSNAGALPATSNVTYNISPSLSTTSLTISAWINATTIAASPGLNMFLASYGHNGDGDVRWNCNRTGPTTYTISLAYNFLTNSWQFSTSASLTTGTWVHVAMTILGGSVFSNVSTSYVNGGFIGSQTSATRTNTNNLFRITVGSFCSGLYNSQFNGIVQDVRIYNQALTSAQIQTIYQSGGNLYGANTVQPSLLWIFDGTAVDSIKGIVPTLANVNGVYTTGNYSSWASSLTYNSTTAKYGSAITLRNPNGPTITNNALYFTNTSGFNLPFGGSNTSTVSFWVKILNTYVSGTDNTILFLSRDSGGSTYYIANYGTNIGTYGSWTGDGLNGPSYNVTPVNGTWYHLTLVTTSTSSTIYLNASPGTTVSYTGILGTNSNVWNGLALASYDFGSASVRGATSSIEIDDLRFYNTALSARQIQGIYQSQGIPPSLTMANTVQPSLLFSLNGTTNDSILGIQGVVSLGTTQYVTGRYGQAFNFLNTTQGSVATNYITATQSAVTFSNTAGFSTSFWVNPTPAQTATQYWFGIFNGSTEILRGYVTSGGAGNGLQIFVVQGSVYPTTRTFIPSLQWSHVAFVINATTISMYFNGVYQSGASGVYTSTGLSSFTGPINLGSSQSGSSLGLLGYMQDFRMYNTALSAQQIQGIYLSGGAPPQARLTSG